MRFSMRNPDLDDRSPKTSVTTAGTFDNCSIILLNPELSTQREKVRQNAFAVILR